MGMLEIAGIVRVRLWKKGRLVLDRSGRNVVTQLGKERFAAILADNAGTFDGPSHMGIGDGTTVPEDTDTALDGTEHQREATAAPVVVADEITWTATFTGGVTPIEVNEAGIFDQASPGGLMFARFLTQRFDLENGDTAVIDWKMGVGGVPSF